ncbi:2',3'-cyclic-nucleotide 2'-phosphodiesterase (5'-nucleotidase family)/predicted extracellular nuclease [Paenibacillus phyllosphaerae]|uniref:2',3'-cyclic-nucleotide 2'-phosphodiesterase (5'-nucleotidase family)/predicted extracellular nuclease n=1 Tax=Paenibacillus phyllosphaerae TaxID=274593 RepID=A0A7W5FPB9_9BACL|nr:5'-nucleotidase C-terminal domain-containing protein [Paenibacillus phyllosphaerae]MBB3112195.1 2',3'-cyclic-nucleotide 2'-phosphodiesterase (5'-nucleotidase family)/predicted extracellular nuclease [Paenibacillus phyllosphaerae]
MYLGKAKGEEKMRVTYHVIKRRVSTILAGSLLAGVVLTGYGLPVHAAVDGSNIVISQVYGGGGNGGAPLKNDFIELYNPTNQDIDLTGWQIEYASATGAWPTSGSNIHTLTSGTIKAGGYYLVQEAAGASTTAAALPSPDQSGNLAMGGTNGKIRIKDNSGSLVDQVGYGTVNEAEGGAATGAISATTSAIRKDLASGGRGLDTDVNANDFNVATPDPRNSSYGFELAQVTASPGTGVVTSGTAITLTTTTAGASIYYKTADDTEFKLYEAPIVITKDTTIESYAKLGESSTVPTTFTYTLSSVSTISAARVLADGTSAIIAGIVTHKETSGGMNNLYVQDATGGIVVRGSALTAEVGDKVEAAGTALNYFGLAELMVDAGNVKITQAGAGTPEPQLVEGSDIGAANGEAYEAEFVKVQNVTIGTGNSYNEFQVTDSKGNAFMVKSPYVEAGQTYEQIQGVLTYTYNNYMLVPRSQSDVAKKLLSVVASPSAVGRITAGTPVTLSTPATGGQIYYTTDGSAPTAASTPYTGVITVNADTTIKAIVVASGQTSEVYSFAYTIQQSYDNLAIHAIQGASHQSPYVGHTVTGVQGIVTQKRSDGKFYIQAPKSAWDNDDKTSEAILLEPKVAVTVAVGDSVTVSGSVAEVKEEGYADANDLLTTQITASAVTKGTSGNAVPDAIVIGRDRIQPTSIIDNDGFTKFDPEEDALDFYESLEGMRVQLNDARIIGPFDFEVPVLLGDQSASETLTAAGGVMLTEDDMNPQKLLIAKEPSSQVKTGDKFNGAVTGVLTYDYSNYKVTPDSALPSVTSSSNARETTSLTPVEDKLSVASFNIENFWNNTSASEVTRKNNIAKAIVSNLKQPDIVALVEVQDNNGPTDSGTVDASASFEALIAEIKAAGGPEYSYTDIAPVNNQDGGQGGGNIRVGYLYNPARVTLVEKEAGKGSATQAVTYGENGLSVNPGRIDPTNEAFDASRKPLAAEFEFKGERVITIASHFNSKGGDEAPYGAVQPLPETLGSEVQRHKIAAVVNNFVDSIYEQDPDANVIILGDLNDFQFSKTLEITKGDKLTNLVDALPANDRYSYVYQGNSQTLDHLLVSNSLASVSELDIVHINADFDTNLGRVSDHDPLLAQIDVLNKPEEEEDFNLRVLHTNDTHAHLDNVAKRISAIKAARNEDTLLLDAGDVFSGTLYFNKFNGLADLWFMNYVGYDAMTFGNHEFDKGTSALKDFVTGATFPFVSANADFSKDANLSGLFKDEVGAPADDANIYPAIIKEINGEQVGIIGLTTEDTASLSSPGDVTFKEHIASAQAAVEMLEEAGVNKIVALSHLGYSVDQEVAEQVEGIDIIVGGHSHTTLKAPEVHNADSEPTIIVQTGEYGTNLGQVDAIFNEDGVLTSWAGKLTAVDTFAEDPEAAKKLNEEYKPALEALKTTVVGKTSVTLDGERGNVRKKETNFGNLVTDGMRAKVQSLVKENDVKGYVTIQNGGGIRASIKYSAEGKQDGDITLGEVMTVMPFGNNLTALKMTGEEIIAALENGVSGVTTGEGRFPQVSGMRYYYDSTKQGEIVDSITGEVKQVGQRIVKVEIKQEDGTFKAIDPSAYYIVATNSFMANGGDFYRSMAKAKGEGRFYELNLVDYEVFNEYIAKVGTLNPTVEGRITDLQGQSLAKGAALSGSGSVKAGKDTGLTYGLDGVDGEVYAQDITMTYDATKLELVSVTSKDPEKFVVVEYEEKTLGTIRILGIHLDGAQADPNQELAQLTFKAKAEAGNGSTTIAVANLVAANGQGVETKLDGTSYNLNIVSVDTAALNSAIAEAQSVVDAAVEGNRKGQYPRGSKATLQAAIDAAKVVAANEDATQAQVEQAATELAAALQKFRSLVITQIPGDNNNDDKVSIGDLAVVAKAYGMKAGDEGWNAVSAYDLNGDGKIGLEDLVILARQILDWE